MAASVGAALLRCLVAAVLAVGMCTAAEKTCLRTSSPFVEGARPASLDCGEMKEAESCPVDCLEGYWHSGSSRFVQCLDGEWFLEGVVCSPPNTTTTVTTTTSTELTLAEIKAKADEAQSQYTTHSDAYRTQGCVSPTTDTTCVGIIKDVNKWSDETKALQARLAAAIVKRDANSTTTTTTTPTTGLTLAEIKVKAIEAQGQWESYSELFRQEGCESKSTAICTSIKESVNMYNAENKALQAQVVAANVKRDTNSIAGLEQALADATGEIGLYETLCTDKACGPRCTLAATSKNAICRVALEMLEELDVKAASQQNQLDEANKLAATLPRLEQAAASHRSEVEANKLTCIKSSCGEDCAGNTGALCKMIKETLDELAAKIVKVDAQVAKAKALGPVSTGGAGGASGSQQQQTTRTHSSKTTSPTEAPTACTDLYAALAAAEAAAGVGNNNSEDGTEHSEKDASSQNIVIVVGASLGCCCLVMLCFCFCLNQGNADKTRTADNLMSMHTFASFDAEEGAFDHTAHVENDSINKAGSTRKANSTKSATVPGLVGVGSAGLNVKKNGSTKAGSTKKQGSVKAPLKPVEGTVSSHIKKKVMTKSDAEDLLLQRGIKKGDYIVRTSAKGNQFITICGGRKSGTFFNVRIEQDHDDDTFEIDGEIIKAKTTKGLLNKFIQSPTLAKTHLGHALAPVKEVN